MRWRIFYYTRGEPQCNPRFTRSYLDTTVEGDTETEAREAVRALDLGETGYVLHVEPADGPDA